MGLLLAFAAYWGYEKLPVEQVMQGAAAAQAQLSGMVQLPEIATPTATPVQGDAAARPAQPSPSPTRTPTATPTRPPSATPSPTPTATATGGAREYIVQSGDSLALIGEKLDLPWRAIATLNGLTMYSMLQPGDKLRLPTLTPAPTRSTATPASGTTRTNTPTAAPSASATASPTATPVAIGTPTGTPAETARPSPSAVASPTATRQATPTSTSVPSLMAPALGNPGDQASYSGDTAQIVLEWQSRDGLPRGAVYRLTITWTEKGVPQSYPWDTMASSLRAAGWLWGRADQPARQYTWSVQIVQLATDGKGGERPIPLSPPSERRTFYWN